MGSFSDGLPVPVRGGWINSSSQNARKVRAKRFMRKVPGVWRITKYASLLGPTVAIFLYSRLSNIYEKYEPILTTELREALRNFATNREFSPPGRRSVSLRTGRSGNNPYVLKVANEVVRIMNRSIREHAVISRIQMDDDQYEFNRLPNGTELTQIAEEVIRDVMDTGSGKFLAEEEKDAVRKMVIRSIR